MSNVIYIRVAAAFRFKSKPCFTNMKSSENDKIPTPTREQMVALLNEDLAREYQAIIAYTV